MTLAISQAGLTLIENFEGFRADAYWDPYGDVWTIGYGTTSAVGFVTVTQGMTCTRAQAQDWLEEFVNQSVIPAIEAACAVNGTVLNQNQVDALCSLGYNVGAGCFQADWSIGAALRAGDLSAVSADFLLYDESGGQVLPGLVTRRHDEQALFDTPVPPTPEEDEMAVAATVDKDGKVHVFQETSDGTVYGSTQTSPGGAFAAPFVVMVNGKKPPLRA